MSFQQGLGSHGTFVPNKVESIHRWYPYLEGYSAQFVDHAIERWANGPVNVMYEPFAGTGTSLIVAAFRGIDSYYSEVNPFMRLVVETKTNHLAEAKNGLNDLRKFLLAVIEQASRLNVDETSAKEQLASSFPGRPYFVGLQLSQIVALRKAIETLDGSLIQKDYAKLALGSIGIEASEMKRQGDLRYRNEKEAVIQRAPAFDLFLAKVNQIIEDISSNDEVLAPTTLLQANAVLPITDGPSVDFIVTSPPYLNGTNYFRNTKIELWLAGLIEHERDLTAFTREAMIAGINNVSKNSRSGETFEFVEKVVRQLDLVSYDSRISKMVRGYALDTFTWLGNISKMLRSGGRAVVDIGDSRFAGVHVPTDLFLIEIAAKVGLTLIDVQLVRVRKSKDGTDLKQVQIVLEKP